VPSQPAGSAIEHGVDWLAGTGELRRLCSASFMPMMEGLVSTEKLVRINLGVVRNAD
jgi:hypothetical protein